MAPTQKKPHSSSEAFSTPRTRDEERDFDAFRTYLASLSPEELWDVSAHLDENRFPRRSEAIVREMARRRLFFLTPYTETELRLRTLSIASVLFALLAAVINGIPALVALMVRIAQSLGAADSGYVPDGRVSFMPGLSSGEEKLFAALLPPARGGASIALLVVCGAALFAAVRFGQKKMRHDVLITLWVAALIAGGLLRLSFA